MSIKPLVMIKKISLLLLVAACVACGKNKHQKPICSGVCTESYATFGINFVDKTGESISVKDLTVTNLRTNKVLDVKQLNAPNSPIGYRTIITDSNIKDLSTEGDDIKISATNPVSNQTKTVSVKIGTDKCACHIDKKSGPDKVAFD
jgi:hypothetical protein